MPKDGGLNAIYQYSYRRKKVDLGRTPKEQAIKQAKRPSNLDSQAIQSRIIQQAPARKQTNQVAPC